jgi:hypothetical protein
MKPQRSCVDLAKARALANSGRGREIRLRAGLSLTEVGSEARAEERSDLTRVLIAKLTRGEK